jgi:uncharacterized membrane protein
VLVDSPPVRPAEEAREGAVLELEPHAAGLLARLILLSDGVFAIAKTLLVVELAVPEVASASGTDLGQQLRVLWPRCLGCAISFLVIASY